MQLPAISKFWIESATRCCLLAHTVETTVLKVKCCLMAHTVETTVLKVKCCLLAHTVETTVLKVKSFIGKC